MKQLRLIVILAAVGVLAACSCATARPDAAAAESPHARKALTKNPHAPGESLDGVPIRDERGNAIVQKIGFHVGISSVTVERLARRFGCTGRVGAGLITDEGPAEVYRMQCGDGTTFLAECELRQCRPLR